MTSYFARSASFQGIANLPKLLQTRENQTPRGRSTNFRSGSEPTGAAAVGEDKKRVSVPRNMQRSWQPDGRRADIARFLFSLRHLDRLRQTSCFAFDANQRLSSS